MKLLFYEFYTTKKIVNMVGKYDILGTTLDEPPGAVFDKIARGLMPHRKEDNISCVDDHHNHGSVLRTGKDLEDLAKSGNW